MTSPYAMRIYIYLCFEFSGFHRNSFSTQAAAEADRESKAPRGTIQSEASSGAPSDPCTNPACSASLRVCCSINASPVHDEAAHAHHLIIRACACHNATRMGALLVSSHRLRIQAAISLPRARIARLLTCLPHLGPLSLPPSPPSREDDGDDAAAPGASAAAAAAPDPAPAPSRDRTSSDR